MSEWTNLTVAELTQVNVSNVDKKEKPGEKVIRLCNYMDVYSNDYIVDSIDFMVSTASTAECAKFKVEKGDILITKDSESPYDIGIPSVVISDIENLVCGYHLALLKPKNNVINSVFLSKQLSTTAVISYFSRVAAGSTRYGLSNGAIAHTEISFPALKYQNKIADILVTCDQTIEKTEALIEKYQQIKAGLMHDLFTRGITTDGKLRPTREQAPELYQETPIGWIAKDWSLTPLNNMAEIVSGVTLGSKISPDQTIEVPYLRVANVQDGYLNLNEVKTIRVNQNTLANLLLKDGDVLMNEGGDFDKLGRGTVWHNEIEPCIHQNHVFRVRTNKEILLPYYLAFWSESNFGKKYFILSSKQSTNLASINSTQLKAYPIGLPCIVEQLKIETRIKAVVSKIRILKQEREKLLSQKSGLMQDLLTGKVPVKVKEPKAAHV